LTQAIVQKGGNVVGAGSLWQGDTAARVGRLPTANYHAGAIGVAVVELVFGDIEEEVDQVGAVSKNALDRPLEFTSSATNADTSPP
jgi:hypothetical protein